MNGERDQQGATITDDRGVVRPLWSPSPARTPVESVRGTRAGQQLRLALSVIAVLVLTVLTLAGNWSVSGLGWSDLVVGAAILAAGVIAYLALALLLEPRYETPLQKFKGVMLERGRCPSCDAHLNDRFDPDGCRICSSCGGAWRPRQSVWAACSDRPTLLGAAGAGTASGACRCTRTAASSAPSAGGAA